MNHITMQSPTVRDVSGPTHFLQSRFMRFMFRSISIVLAVVLNVSYNYHQYCWREHKTRRGIHIYHEYAIIQNRDIGIETGGQTVGRSCQ